MPELKNFDPATAVQAVEKALADAQSELERVGQRALSLLKDAKDGIEAMENGVGPLLERAEHVYVTTFALEPYRGQDELVPCDPCLHFDSTQYRVPLDPMNWHHRPDYARPVLRASRRYRVIVILEPVE